MNYSILGPLFVLAGWTAFVLALIPICRITAALQGKVKQADFRLADAQCVPEWVQLPNRNYMNLLELPVLFYVISLILLITQQHTDAMLHTAWCYTGLRILHSIIHLTINQVIARMLVFATSNFVLLTLWILAGVRLAGI